MKIVTRIARIVNGLVRIIRCSQTLFHNYVSVFSYNDIIDQVLYWINIFFLWCHYTELSELQNYCWCVQLFIFEYILYFYHEPFPETNVYVRFWHLANLVPSLCIWNDFIFFWEYSIILQFRLKQKIHYFESIKTFLLTSTARIPQKICI